MTLPLQEIVKSMVRHAVTAGGAVLIAKGLADEESVSSVANGTAEIAVGVAAYGVGQLFSIAHKLKIFKLFGFGK